MTYRCCPSCAVGLMTYSQASGEWTCAGCDARTMLPPLCWGGQGRDASEVEADAVGTVRLVVLAILSAAILALGVWAAGGGR